MKVMIEFWGANLKSLRSTKMRETFDVVLKKVQHKRENNIFPSQKLLLQKCLGAQKENQNFPYNSKHVAFQKVTQNAVLSQQRNDINLTAFIQRKEDPKRQEIPLLFCKQILQELSLCKRKRQCKKE